MPEAPVPTPTPTHAPVAPRTPAELAVASAREKLSRYVGRAVEIITELAETAENERVRLAAADSILDRAGLGKTQTMQVEQGNAAEHEAARREAEDMIKSLGRNKAEVNTGPVVRDLEVLIVLEGETEEAPAS